MLVFRASRGVGGMERRLFHDVSGKKLTPTLKIFETLRFLFRSSFGSSSPDGHVWSKDDLYEEIIIQHYLTIKITTLHYYSLNFLENIRILRLIRNVLSLPGGLSGP